MRALVAPDQRVVAGAASVSLSYQFHDADGEPAAPAGAVTVNVVSSDGTAVVTGQAATDDGTNPVVSSLTSGISEVDRLTVTWLDDGTAVATTVVDVVGGVYASVAKMKEFEPTLESYSNDVLIAARYEVELMIEEICNRAFVPRLEVERINGTWDRVLPVSWPNVQSLKWGKEWYSGNSSTSLTSAEVADVKGGRGAQLVRQDGYHWNGGVDNIEVAYIHGWDRPPADIQRACAAMVRRQLTVSNKSLSDTASQYFPPEGGSVLVPQPGQRGSATGVPWIDEILRRYKHVNSGVY